MRTNSPTCEGLLADDARKELYGRLSEKWLELLRHFYECERPEFYSDERSKLAIARSLDGMHEWFAILNEYEISRTPPPVAVVIVEGEKV